MKMAKKVTKKDVKLTGNFSLSEFTYSRSAEASGLKNEPTAAQLKVIRWVAENVMQPYRDTAGPTKINSALRSKQVNKLVGGEDTSFHLYNEGRWAVDFVTPAISLFEAADIFKELRLPCTKLIVELDQGVVHIQGVITEYLVRDVIKGKKVYSFLDSYKRED